MTSRLEISITSWFRREMSLCRRLKRLIEMGSQMRTVILWVTQTNQRAMTKKWTLTRKRELTKIRLWKRRQWEGCRKKLIQAVRKAKTIVKTTRMTVMMVRSKWNLTRNQSKDQKMKVKRQKRASWGLNLWSVPSKKRKKPSSRSSTSQSSRLKERMTMREARTMVQAVITISLLTRPRSSVSRAWSLLRGTMPGKLEKKLTPKKCSKLRAGSQELQIQIQSRAAIPTLLSSPSYLQANLTKRSPRLRLQGLQQLSLEKRICSTWTQIKTSWSRMKWLQQKSRQISPEQTSKSNLKRPNWSNPSSWRKKRMLMRSLSRRRTSR